ncbi:DNA ligase [Variovorax sp. J22R133]|uniref:DNA ligase n=1 Tax=Variovorax brevis TaxID=3053503 RepID=UPI002578ED33|nr:DNA ligase [Variovorax sp. J22R133]MDM0111176.1 DNA ligase [Variovorax sp. J22R133]
MLNRRTLLLAGWLCACAPAIFAREAPPSLMQAEVYRPGMPLDDYWVSEKFDGVRGYWDGKRFRTRGGEPVVAPDWFTVNLPNVPLDGELWAGRGQFARAMSTVRSQTPSDNAWHEMRFMVFDMPAQPGPFTERLAALRKLLPIPSAPWVVPVAQQRATTAEDLQALLDKTIRIGGEGLMLHRGASLYRGERNADLLKVKPFEDAEAKVVAHVPGKGRLTGRVGALMVESPEGRRFKLGSGLTDAERDAPPAIGTWITYRYNGTNASGVPRFARFMRVRPDLGA